MNHFFTLLLVLTALGTKADELLRTSCDCKTAVPLTIAKGSKYGPTQAPQSYGQLQEITTRDKNSEIAFEQEHNSAWYLLNIQVDGQLTFDIVPTDSSDDYDFLLYPYNDTGFCNKVTQQKVIPVRGNISNNTSYSRAGKTGLATDALKAFYPQGPGKQFSLPLQVKKGEKYMLVLDNVTPHGSGHALFFYNLQPVELSGQVVNEDSLPVVASVTLADLKGQTVATTNTDNNGKYHLKTAIEPKVNYTLTFTNDSSFIGTAVINTNQLQSTQTFPPLKTVLPKLKKGAKYPVGNINFYGGLATLLPISQPSVEALWHLMQRNKKMVILIEGHVNAAGMFNVGGRESYPGSFQQLSEDRAATVYEYLVDHGIAPERLKTVGRAATHMLFPYAKNEKEASANRRVEIQVLSLHGE